ncbi:tyrosine recombinase XerC [Enterococcus timonensis]|uniref:tyrosine recombinase XerC n=1 Tax=Enterococcus timonensis TaxID=1852364 RepID=UPI0008D9DF39|nr:tyrosine recombinase XerC [Enterococcus timonensis]
MTEKNWPELFFKYLHTQRGYSPLTIDIYHDDLRDYLAFLKTSGDANYLEVEPLDVRSYLGFLYEKKYARNTVSRKISALRSFYQFLLKNEVLDENPFSYLHLRKGPSRLPKFFYEEEMNVLFETASGSQPLDYRNTALLEVFYATGLRVSEACQLQIFDVDFQLGVVLLHGKGNKERYVPIGSFAQDALKIYFEKSRTPLMTKYHKEHQFVFVNRLGEPITDRGIRYVFTQLVKKSSLTTTIHPHMFRHTFATHLLNNGADMRTVQELLGHVNLSSTQIYTHVTTDRLQESYDKFFPRA